MYSCRFINGGEAYFTESGVNQYAGQKTLADVFGARLLFLELSYFRNILLLYHFRMLLHVFMRREHLLSGIISLVFCSVQYRTSNVFSHQQAEMVVSGISATEIYDTQMTQSVLYTSESQSNEPAI